MLTRAGRGYLTRRIRKVCTYEPGTQLATKQLVLPLTIGPALEKYILESIPSRYDTLLPANFLTRPLLIPVASAAAHGPYAQVPAMLPPLRDSDLEEPGNLRYLVVSDQAMWKGGSPAQDLIVGVLRVLAETWQMKRPAHFQRVIALAHWIGIELGHKYGFNQA